MSDKPYTLIYSENAAYEPPDVKRENFEHEHELHKRAKELLENPRVDGNDYWVEIYLSGFVHTEFKYEPAERITVYEPKKL